MDELEKDLTYAYMQAEVTVPKNIDKIHRRYTFHNGKDEITITRCPSDPASLHIKGTKTWLHMGKSDIQALIKLLQEILEEDE